MSAIKLSNILQYILLYIYEFDCKYIFLLQSIIIEKKNSKNFTIKFYEKTYYCTFKLFQYLFMGH